MSDDDGVDDDDDDDDGRMLVCGTAALNLRTSGFAPWKRKKEIQITRQTKLNKTNRSIKCSTMGTSLVKSSWN